MDVYRLLPDWPLPNSGAIFLDNRLKSSCILMLRVFQFCDTDLADHWFSSNAGGRPIASCAQHSTATEFSFSTACGAPCNDRADYTFMYNLYWYRTISTTAGASFAGMSEISSPIHFHVWKLCVPCSKLQSQFPLPFPGAKRNCPKSCEIL